MCEPPTPEHPALGEEGSRLVDGDGSRLVGDPVCEEPSDAPGARASSTHVDGPSGSSAAAGASDVPAGAAPDFPRRPSQPPRSLLRRVQERPASPCTRARTPILELVVVPRIPELQAAEHALSMALVALVLGTRPHVSPAMVLEHLGRHYGIAEDRVSVRRTKPDDFIVRFSRVEDLELVLGSAPPPEAQFTLRWRRWSRLFMASAGAFRFRVLVGMKGKPFWVPPALASTSRTPRRWRTPATSGKLFVATWCAHPDLIPDEKIMAVPEWEEEHDGGSPLYLRPHEIIHDEVPALRYLVRLRIVEFRVPGLAYSSNVR